MKIQAYVLSPLEKNPLVYIKAAALNCVATVSILHNLDLGKVSPAKQLLIHQVGIVNSRHFSNIEVVKNTDLRI